LDHLPFAGFIIADFAAESKQNASVRKRKTQKFEKLIDKHFLS